MKYEGMNQTYWSRCGNLRQIWQSKVWMESVAWCGAVCRGAARVITRLPFLFPVFICQLSIIHHWSELLGWLWP